MKNIIKVSLLEIKGFLSREYIILILIITLGIKLSYFASLIGLNYPFSNMCLSYLASLITAVVLLYPLVFLPKKKNLVAITICTTLSVALLLDLLYFKFFQSLPTFGLLSAFDQTRDIAPSALSLLSRNDLILFVDIVAVLSLEIFLRKVWPKSLKEQKVGVVEKILGWMLLAVMVLIILAFRYIEKPKIKLIMAFSQSYETRQNVQYFGILGGHLIDGYRYATEILKTVSPEEKTPIIAWVKANLSQKTASDPMTGAAKGKRVIMIQVESLGGYVIGSQINGQAITPNLNDLTSGSHYFADNRFVIGAGHTSDTDFVVNASLYPLYDSSAFVRYGNDNYTGLADILAENGYTTAAYHAYNRSFWNRGAAFNSLGYQKFYAAESYPAGTMFNIYGLNDKDFFQRTAEYIAGNPEKSLNYAITLSSHYPFEINKETSGLNLEGANLPPVASGYLQNIHYADAAIGNFIAELKQKNLYDDSLIIVVGDHNSPNVESFTADGISYDPTGIAGLRVPLIIKTPGQSVGTVTRTTTTSLDIVPTILDLLGTKTTTPMFGQSLFTKAGDALPRCTGGEVIHIGTAANCTAELLVEKSMAEKIIKYNLFSSLKD